jgi:hypothetical protein
MLEHLDPFATLVEVLDALFTRRWTGERPDDSKAKPLDAPVDALERCAARKARASVHILVHAALYDGIVTAAERRVFEEHLGSLLRASRSPNTIDELTDLVALLHETLDPHEIEERVRRHACALEPAERAVVLDAVHRVLDAPHSTAPGGPSRSIAPIREDPREFFARALGIAER